MKLTLAVLADAATPHDDGKISILGGGVDALRSDSFPFVYGNLALVMKLQFEPDECATRHFIEIRSLREDGKEFLPLFVLAAHPTVRQGQPNVPVTLPLVRTMRDVRFDSPGRYRFEVLVDKDQLAVMELQVLFNPIPPPESAAIRDVLRVSLMTGYEAFVAEDLERAWSIISSVVKEFPHSADAQNNFGFILLARGQAREALQAFKRAEAAGYGNRDLVGANIACCLFLLKQYKVAFDVFSSLIKLRFLSESAVLFALGRSTQVPLQLSSPADYFALAALNAARSAVAAGLPKEAVEFSQVATAGRLSFQDERSRTAFDKLLSELSADIQGAGVAK